MVIFVHRAGNSTVEVRVNVSLFLPKRDYVTFGYFLLQIRLSCVTFVHPTQPVEIFGDVSMPFSTLAIR